MSEIVAPASQRSSPQGAMKASVSANPSSPVCEADIASILAAANKGARRARRMAAVAILISVLTAVGCGLALVQTVSMPASNAGGATAKLDQQIRDLRTELSTQRFDLTFLKLRSDRTTATLDPASSGYSSIQNENGILFVAIENVEPYLDGVKVKLSVGNPMSCSYTDAKMTLKFGPRFDSSRLAEKDYYASYEKACRTTTVDILNSIEPGQWNSVSAILTPIEPSAFGMLEVSIKPSGMTLRTFAGRGN